MPVFDSKPCAVCSTTFQPTQLKQKFCSVPCRNKSSGATRRSSWPDGACWQCGQMKGMSYCDDCRAKHNQRSRDRHYALRNRIFKAYGGKCACCGERRREFLAIDHILGGGLEHRRKMGGCRNVYRAVESQGYPKDLYRILCHNCNSARGFYGYCPHEREREGAKPKLNFVFNAFDQAINGTQAKAVPLISAP